MNHSQTCIFLSSEVPYYSYFENPVRATLTQDIMTSCFPGDKRRSVSVDTQDERRPRKVARTDRQDDVTEQERSSYSNSSRHRGYSFSSEREEPRNKKFRDRKHRKKGRQLGNCEQRGCSDAHLDRDLQCTGRKTSKRRIVPERSLPPGDYRQYGMAPDTEENQRGRQTAPDSHGQEGTIPRPLADLIEKGKGISLYDVLKVIPLGTQQLKHLLSGVLGQPERSAEDTERRQLYEQSGHVECDRSEVDRESTFCDKRGVDSEHMDSQQMRLLHPGTYEQQGMVYNATETQHSQSQQTSLYDKLQMSKAKDHQQGRYVSSDSYDEQCEQRPLERQSERSQQSSLYDKLQMMSKAKDDQKGRGLSCDSLDQQCCHQPSERQPDRGQQSSLYDKLQMMSKARDHQQGRYVLSGSYDQQYDERPLERQSASTQQSDHCDKLQMMSAAKDYQKRRALSCDGLDQQYRHQPSERQPERDQTSSLYDKLQVMSSRDYQQGRRLQSHEFGQEGRLPTSVEGLQGREIPLDNGLRQELPPGNMREQPGPGVTHWGKQQRLMPRDTDGQHSQGVMSGNLDHQFPLPSAASTGSCQQWLGFKSRPHTAGTAEDDSVKQEQESNSRPTTRPAPLFPPPGSLQKSASEPEKTVKRVCTVSDVII